MNGSPAPVWVIGDLQGCKPSLDRLLASPELAADPASRFWFAGDLVNRGPDSLGTLRKVIALGDQAVSVLGNHDLHLLAVAAGVRTLSKSDTLDDIFNAPDADDLIHWLRHRPLAHYEHQHLLVHAGVLPCWTLATALTLANEVQDLLRAPDWKRSLKRMYGNKPVRWDNDLKGGKRLRVIINAFTRMRWCNQQGDLDFSHKADAQHQAMLMPWFDVPNRAAADTTIVFGHWSQLGLTLKPNIVCLDSGCIWGRELTAMRLHDRKLVQVSCPGYRKHSETK